MVQEKPCAANSGPRSTASRPDKSGLRGGVRCAARARAALASWPGRGPDRTGCRIPAPLARAGAPAWAWAGRTRHSLVLTFIALGRRRARMPKREGYTQPSLREPGLHGSQSSTLRPAVGLFRKAVGHTRSGLHAERGVCCNGMCHGLARAERPARQEDVAAARMARVLCPAHVRLEILIPRKARLGRPASVPLHAREHRSALKFSVPVASASPI